MKNKGPGWELVGCSLFLWLIILSCCGGVLWSDIEAARRKGPPVTKVIVGKEEVGGCYYLRAEDGTKMSVGWKHYRQCRPGEKRISNEWR